MKNPDELLFTRHVTAHMNGNVDKDKISEEWPVFKCGRLGIDINY